MTKTETLQQLRQVQHKYIKRLGRLANYTKSCPEEKKFRLVFLVTRIAVILAANRNKMLVVRSQPEPKFEKGGVCLGGLQIDSAWRDEAKYIIPDWMLKK